MPDPYKRHEADENRLRAALFGAAGAGVLYKLRTIPPRVWIPGGSWHGTAPMIRQRRANALARSTWWTAPWAEYLESTTETLERITRESMSPIIRRLGGRMSQEAQAVTEANAVAAAREYAATLAAQIEADTFAGLKMAMGGLERGIPAGELRRQLAARLGPTAKQLSRIHRWERRVILEGKMTRSQILAELKRRARRAAMARARPMASDALVRQVSESRTAVFSAAGVLVSSGNPLDDATRDLHAEQTAVTRATPTPAGQPWAAGAPFAGSPPYEILCRCWIEGG